MTVLASTAPHLRALAARAQHDGRLPSLVAGVLRDGELVWTYSRGTAVREASSERPDAETQYRIGSITKTMTAVLVLQLRDEGALALEDRVDAHVADAPFGASTIRGLLSHDAGLPAEPRGPWWERSRGGSYDELVAANAGAVAVLPVGQQYHYSNLAYAILGRIVEQHRGRTWAAAAQDYLWDRLGMTRTSYAAVAPHADGFSVDALSGTLTREPHQDTGAMAPAGQVWSTVTDLATWGHLLAGGHPEVLGSDALHVMTTPQSAAPDESLTGAYGLGVRLAGPGPQMLAGHTGSMPGFLAGLFVDPETKVGAVVLANGGYGLEAEALPRALIDTTLRHEPILAAEWSPTTSVPAAHGELLGTWHWGHAPFLMTTDDTTLQLRSVGSDRGFGFVATAEDLFVGTSGYQTAETMRVVRRDDGTISHLDVGTFCYTRTPYDPRAPIPGAGDPLG